MEQFQAGKSKETTADAGTARATVSTVVIRAMARFASADADIDPQGSLHRMTEEALRDLSQACGHPVHMSLLLDDEEAPKTLTWGNPVFVSTAPEHKLYSSCMRASLAFSEAAAQQAAACVDLVQPLLDTIVATFSRFSPADREPAKRSVLPKRSPRNRYNRTRMSADQSGAVFQMAPVAIITVHAQSRRVLRANAAFLRLSGLRLDQVLDSPLSNYLDAEAVDALTPDFPSRTTGSTAEKFAPVNARLRNAEARGLPVMVQSVKVPSRHRGMDFCLMLHDCREHVSQLTQVTLERDSLRHQYDDLKSSSQAVAHGIVLLDAHANILWANNSSYDLFDAKDTVLQPGKSLNEFFKHGCDRGLFPEAVGNEKVFLARLMADLRANNDPVVLEVEGDVRLQLSRRSMPDGRSVLIIDDVTAQKSAERRLSQVIDGSQAGTWELDVGTGSLQINPRFAWMIGYSPAELEPFSLHDFLARVVKDDVVDARSAFDSIFSGARDRLELTVQVRHRHGFLVWIQLRGRVVARRKSGAITRIAGVTIDVTALKRAEQRLEQIIEGVDVGTWQFDRRSGLCRINDRAAQILGFERKELEPFTRQVLLSLLHPEDSAAIDRLFASGQLKKDEQFSTEIRLRHRDGHWVWVMCRGRVNERDTNGVPFLSSGVLLDIGARKLLESELREERDFLATLTDASDSGILAVDENARVIFANPEVANLLECRVEDLIGQVCSPTTMLLSQENGSELAFENLPCQLALRARHGLRNIRLRKNFTAGRYKLLSVNSVPFHSETYGRMVMCTLTDVTAMDVAQRKLQAETRRAEAANKAKSDFLAAISHELRTPLHGILGMAELLDRKASSEDQPDLIRAIRDSGQHLLCVVNDLLDLNKVESGHMTLELGPMRLEDLASRIADLHGRHARSMGLEFKVTLDSGARITRLGDSKRVLQVLHNIVGNSVKFTPRGKVHLDIRGQSNFIGDTVVIKVSDTGIGMSDSQIKGAWSAFGATSSSESLGRFSGTGLGLSLVRKMVDRMGGTVNLTSKQGQGTVVVVTLPLPPVAQEPTKKPMFTAPDVAQRLKGRRALIADDNATNRLILSSALRKLGLIVDVAESGRRALEKAMSEDYDVILLDIAMPDKTGPDVLNSIIANPRGPLPPILAVTAHAMTHELESYRELGFSDVLTKPVDLGDLAESLVRVLPQSSDMKNLPLMRG